MSSPPGWYPDPGGRAGHFRYWDGRAWSAATTTQPATPPPTQPGQAAPGQVQSGQAQSGSGGSPSTGSPQGAGPSRRSSAGWLLGLIAVGVVVLVVVAVLVVRGTGIAGPGGVPGGQPSGDLCQTASAAEESAVPQSGDRVVSGKLSVPRLGPPFQAPRYDSRVPFGRDVQSQDAPVEVSADGKTSWLAGVLIARLLAGDGFYGPEQGADLVVRCILGVFYGNSTVARDDVKDQATTVDGHQAWLIESKLSFDVPGIKTKGELLIVVVVDVGDGEGGLFYASIPDTTPELVAPARQALAGLRVGS